MRRTPGLKPTPHVRRTSCGSPRIAAARGRSPLGCSPRAPGRSAAERAFHFAVIDEVMFGYGGDPNIQYVEIRDDNGGQNLTAHAILGYFNTDGIVRRGHPRGASQRARGHRERPLHHGEHRLRCRCRHHAGVHVHAGRRCPPAGMICFGGGGHRAR